MNIMEKIFRVFGIDMHILLRFWTKLEGKLKIHYLVVLIIFLSSCGKGKNFVYHYSDGAKIKDSATIKFILREYEKYSNQIKTINGDVHVYTSLVQNPNFSFFIDSIRNKYINDLIQRNSIKKETIYQSPSLFFNCEYVVVENKSGRVKQYFSQEGVSLYETMGRGKSFRTLAFLHALEKEYSPNDEYNVYGFSDSQGHCSIKKAFGIYTGGWIFKYPTEGYSNKDWTKFKKGKNLDLEIGPRTSFGTQIRYNFADLIKLFSSLRNEGKEVSMDCIEGISNTLGKTFYSRILFQETIIDSQTNAEMLELLKYNNRTNRFVDIFMDLKPGELVLSGKNEGDLGWALYSNTDYTIGVRVTGKRRLQNRGVSKWININNKYRRPSFILSVLKSIREQIVMEKT